MNTIKLINRKGLIAFLISSAIAILFIFLFFTKGSSGKNSKQEEVIEQLKEANQRIRDSVRLNENSLLKINKDTVIEIDRVTFDTIRFKKIR